MIDYGEGRRGLAGPFHVWIQILLFCILCKEDCRMDIPSHVQCNSISEKDLGVSGYWQYLT
jgi:hypothetical protein